MFFFSVVYGKGGEVDIININTGNLERNDTNNNGGYFVCDSLELFFFFIHKKNK